MNPSRALVRGLAWELGEFSGKVSELDEFEQWAEAGSAAVPAFGGGFQTYHWSESDPLVLAAPAAERTLRTAGLAPADVDCVVIASDSLHAGPVGHRDIAEFLDSLGIGAVAALTIGMLDCATPIAALQIAASLVRDGTHREILVVCVDLTERVSPGSRVVAGGAAIASDAAATVLVSSTPGGGDEPAFEVLATALHSAPSLRSGTVAQVSLRTRIRAHRELFERLWGPAGYGPADVMRVFSSNLAPEVLGPYLADVGLAGRVHTADIPAIAHCLGGDPIIGLAGHRAARGERVLLFGSGISHLGAALLRAVSP